ncbi:origin recognition complex subunit 2 [Pancytospora philotis]|nr:origin recognition complex subunit 2 [Pancytospora philotis]
MKEDLAAFHRACAPEFHRLLEDFNLLFYGYGCKSALLQELFPDALLFNLGLQSVPGIVEELVMGGYHTSPGATIGDIDEQLGRSKRSLTLILTSFDFQRRELQGLRNVRIVGTVESLGFSFDLDDLRSFNFVMRDLTTFADYTAEVLDIDVTSDRVSGALMVARSVPEKVRHIFRELLTLGSCTIAELFQRTSKALLLAQQRTVVKYLDEFIDHGIVRIKDGSRILLDLNKEERARLLKDDLFKTPSTG